HLANAPQINSVSPLPYSTTGVTATINGLAAPILYVSPTLLNIQIPYSAGAGPAVLGINNNGQIAGYAFQIAPTAPGILADAVGNISPNSSALQGASASLFLTGAGEVSPALKTAFAPSAATAPASQPKPIQPVSITIGGVQAFVQYGSLAPGLIGTARVDFIVPSSVPAGVQPVVVTMGGVKSPPVNLTVLAP
ncbi:MAG TPA: peptidase S8, partial [Bryobacteraceae bacterium]